jgi:hypothetical protein
MSHAVRERISAHSLLSLRSYQRQRREQRARAIAHRRERCLTLGPDLRLQFEDESSVRHQIQEVLHIERIADVREVQHTIDAYAHLLGDADAWTATLFIEMPDASRRDRELPVLSQAAHHLYLGCAGLPRVVAEANRDLADRHLGRPSGVHFLRFALGDAVREALRGGSTAVLGCAHPAYAWQRTVPVPLLRRLCVALEAA